MAYQRFLSFGHGRNSYITQPEAQALLKEANPLLWHAVMWPWDDFQASRRDDPRFRSLSEGDAAWWLHSQIKQFAHQLCDDRQDLGITAQTTLDNQFYLSVRGELIIVFKKLKRVFSRKQGRDVLVRSNYPTNHNCKFWAQRAESGLNAPRLIIGYEPIKAMSEAIIHVGYPRTKGHQFDWIYEMPNQFEEAKKLFKHTVTEEKDAQENRRGFVVVSNPDQAENQDAV